MTNQKRRLALVIALIVCLSMLLSALYIIAEADHDCSGEHCPICDQLHSCENTIKMLSLAAMVTAIAFASTHLLLRSMPLHTENGRTASLISRKVKLSC